MRVGRKLSRRLFAAALLLAVWASSLPAAAQSRPVRIVIHGGTGVLRRQMTPEAEKGVRETMNQALEAGYKILREGGSSLDAVETAVRILEDSPWFNAGRGAVFTHEGTNELDASIMDGATLKAGAVAGVKRIKNPISLARLVMEKSPHVMMAGVGAETFARQQGMTLVNPRYFFTQSRWEALQRAKRAERNKANDKPAPPRAPMPIDSGNLGTVGVVALDSRGNLAAGTSTGGMTNKRFGRIGDAPIIGAGTYADNRTCAVSATGHGEYFIRAVVAHDIAALMAYKGMSLKDAAELVVMDKLVKMGGEGGIIAVDKDGNIAAPFNSEGMIRGWMDDAGKPVVKIFRE